MLYSGGLRINERGWGKVTRSSAKRKGLSPSCPFHRKNSNLYRKYSTYGAFWALVKPLGFWGNEGAWPTPTPTRQCISVIWISELWRQYTNHVGLPLRTVYF